jgi:site-specific DNA-methyltransferase (adenine-specific)
MTRGDNRSDVMAVQGEGTVAEVLAGTARFAVVCGDAAEVLKTLPDECAHVTYCDPPYGLSAQSTRDVVECLRAWLAGEVYTHGRDGFMSASWDAFVPGPDAWREVFRALKPGGYCVAFSSTRTVDLLGIAVRLAGFEMREGMCWVYASGFPKSLDVSKAIDAAEGAEREVVGDNPRAAQQTPKRDDSALGKFNGASPHITAPATPAAAQWSGYGTATKPAFEPLIVARKPLDGTVAANVQRHGCGALNIDAGRIAAGGPSPSVERRESAARSGWDNRGGSIMDDRTDPARYSAPHAGEQLGRFPASVAIVHSEGCERVGVRKVAGITGGRPGTKASGRLGAFAGLDRRVVQYADADGLETVDEWRCADGCAVAVLGEQSGERTSGSGVKGKRSQVSTYGAPSQDLVTNYNGDSGTAARFFFNAKASSADRLAFVSCTPGCTAHETVIGAREARARSTCPACGGARTKHEHATVKPLDLARYHARLLSLPAHVAPVALVPFCGTGVEARALMEVGFRVIAVDLDARHCAMTRRRLAQPLDAEATQPRRKAPAAPVVAAPVATSPVVAARPARRQPVATAQLSLFSPSPKDRA